MLGQQIVDMQGKMTDRRVLPLEQGSPKFETTFEVAGTILGQPAKTFIPAFLSSCLMVAESSLTSSIDDG